MIWADIQKDWKTFSKKFKTKWPDLTEADLTAIAGKREELVTRLVKITKKEKAQVEMEVDDLVKTFKPIKT